LKIYKNDIINIDKKLEIIYEDDYLIILNKVSGILTIPDRFNTELPNLYSILKKIYGKIFIVHRLDKDTSGCVIFAKDAETHRILSMAFESNDIIRKYEVIVEGIVPQDNMEIDIPLRPSRKKVGVTVPSAKGKPSLTKIKVIEKYRNSTLLECELKTGRHHQIRVHLQTIGYPLLVDDLYGNNSEFFVSKIKRKFNLKKGSKEFPLISRLTMHAREVKFSHPITGEIIHVFANYPKDFSALIKILKKYSKI
jgi:23S rRNA pseudouridine955/2504/2580 synthase/23S rRNA pseudouridine1911/1915/1917 synthase